MWSYLLPARRAARRRIQDYSGHVIGRVEELMLDLGSGRIAWAVVRLRRGLALPHHRIAVPMKRLRPMFDLEGYVLDADLASLAGAAPLEHGATAIDDIRALSGQ